MKPYYDHAGITIYHGDCLKIMPQLPAESIQCCVTSPPYWGLRDYGLPPQIWDERKPGHCRQIINHRETYVENEHEWGSEQLVKTGRNDGDRSRLSTGSYDGGGEDKYYVGKQTGSQGQFCHKCNAWRGSLGLEPTIDLYVSHVVQVFREVKRVLRKDGTLWLNLGDSYANTSSGGGGPVDTRTDGRKTTPGDKVRGRMKGVNTMAPGLKPKDLCGIPWRVALALQGDGWWLRSDIIWAKPNPMPESVTDRPTRSHEYVFLLAKSAKYFYDADAVREDSVDPESYKGRKFRGPKAIAATNARPFSNPNSIDKGYEADSKTYCQRNLRSVWTIATEPTPEAHFATFPEKLVIPCIKAGTSEKGCCPECGAPWVRVVEKGELKRSKRNPYDADRDERNYQEQGWNREGGYGPGNFKESKTIGWKPSCSHTGFGNPIPCTVLDSFSGSGKVLVVAQKFGRKGIGIELNPEYCKMPLKKIAQNRMF